MKFADVAENVKKLVANPPSQETFIYELLLAYGTPKASVKRLELGQLNLAKEPGEVLLKKKVWFKNVAQASRLPDPEEPNDNKQAGRSLYVLIDELKTAKATKTNNPRFLIVTDFEQILAIDTKTGETLDIEFSELETHFDFFIPLTPGLDKHTLPNENPADVRAAEKMAKLFDAIKQDNPDYMRHDAHAMNVFLSRLLFCLFAEDTGIFPENAVCNAIASHTAADGSDLDAFFKQLFDWLDTPDQERDGTTKYTKDTKNKVGQASCLSSEGQILTTEHTEDTESNLRKSASSVVQNLPYVNGGLFKDHFDIPVFSRKSRRMIITSGELNWSEINPDIFGSMFQAVIDPEERHNLGQHYTSVTNIMKVIEPLFLNDFKDELEKAKNLSQKNVRAKALQALLDRIANVKIFDPACGSGNFLIIAYKELRQLEMEVFEALNAFPVSRMTVDQFYGIEIADFACETAILALWLAEHQMNLEYEKRFGHSLTSLPLKDGANIVCANATRIDWETVCPQNQGQVFVVGNPPYKGSRVQTPEQKEDMDCAFEGVKAYKDLDYVACWLFKVAHYLKGDSESALVATSSICQGTQVTALWPHVFEQDLETSFAYKSFHWANNAKNKAGVTCSIIGLRKCSNKKKYLFQGSTRHKVRNINAYLIPGKNLFIQKRRKPLSKIPAMLAGNYTGHAQNLMLTTAERNELLGTRPEAESLIKKVIGSNEFIKGIARWCIWIRDDELGFAQAMPEIRKRIELVKKAREESKDKDANKLAIRAHQFRDINETTNQSIVVPTVSSERRDYLPVGFIGSETIVTNKAMVLYDTEPFILGFLVSRIHMVWVRAIAGRMRKDISYSNVLCYNTFPIPELTEDQKQTITMHVFQVLEEREKHPEKTMAQLYDPDKMPDGLRAAHHNLDLAIDRLYRTKPFTSDEERLEHLFKLYEEMTAKEQLV